MHRPTLAALLTLALAAPAAAQSHQHDYAAEMRQAHAGERPVATPAALTPPAQEVVTEEVAYGGLVNGKPVKGFLARPAKGAKQLPAIVVVHEWWGINDNIRAMTKRLAGEGYTALAVDLFGTTASTPDSAMVLYQTAMKNVAAGEQNLGAAIAYLKKQGAPKIGSVGWCFGGHWGLRTALVGGKDVNAVAVYYGPPITDPKQLARLQAPMLGLYGGKDPNIPVDSVRAMERALKQLGKAVEIKIYDDASHAFANPSGQAYNAAAAEDAWKRTVGFFQAHLK